MSKPSSFKLEVIYGISATAARCYLFIRYSTELRYNNPFNSEKEIIMPSLICKLHAIHISRFWRLHNHVLSTSYSPFSSVLEIYDQNCKSYFWYVETLHTLEIPSTFSTIPYVTPCPAQPSMWWSLSLSFSLLLFPSFPFLSLPFPSFPFPSLPFLSPQSVFI